MMSIIIKYQRKFKETLRFQGNDEPYNRIKV